MVKLSVGVYESEARPDEGPLRGDVVQSRVGDHPGQSLVGGNGQQGHDRLRGVAMAAGRGSQAVADLDAAVIWLALETEPPDGPPIDQTGDPVVAERSLLSERGGGAKESPDGANVALERKIVGPSIGRSRTSSNDAFALCDIDCVQLEA